MKDLGRRTIKRLIEYFEELNKKKISYENSDLLNKAKELNLPIPIKIMGEIYFDMTGVNNE